MAISKAEILDHRWHDRSRTVRNDKDMEEKFGVPLPLPLLQLPLRLLVVLPLPKKKPSLMSF